MGLRDSLTWLRKRAAWIISPLLALGITVVLDNFSLDYLEAIFFDGRVRLRPAPQVSKEITIVSVDSETIDTLGKAPDATNHLAFLKTLVIAKPKAVIYMIHPHSIVGSYSELRELANTMSEIEHLYVAVDDVPSKLTTDSFRMVPPFQKIKTAALTINIDRNIFARDEVARRLMTSYMGNQTLLPIVAALSNPEIQDEEKIQGLFEYMKSNQAYIDFRPPRTYPNLSFVRAQSTLTPENFKDKIIIVGRDLQTTIKDYARTPHSRDIVAMTSSEVLANMIDTLIQNTAPRKAPSGVNHFFTFLIALLTVPIVLAVHPTRGLVLLSVLVLSFGSIAFFSFWLGGWWIDMSHPFLALFIAYYFLIPYRLIKENRRSWEYYQKNKLLTQVEELKSNFMSMMSHDLKTPIARIQGMADLIKSDLSNLNQKQKDAIQSISSSTEELLNFVSSVLSLSRMESKEIKLNLQSRDPNSLLEEVVQNLDYVAKSRQVQVQLELEPMFSLKIDTDLMRQVFTNLIENAIKYSPDGSRVLITTEERDGRVIIQIADQGLGIPADEISNIFGKFYRSKNAKASKIKGSGLGLYLAKYFVELHRGVISVDSSPGQGSTFTVELPMTPG